MHSSYVPAANVIETVRSVLPPGHDPRQGWNVPPFITEAVLPHGAPVGTHHTLSPAEMGCWLPLKSSTLGSLWYMKTRWLESAAGLTPSSVMAMWGGGEGGGSGGGRGGEGGGDKGGDGGSEGGGHSLME